MKEKNTLQKSMDKALNEFKNNDIQKSYGAMLSSGMMTCGAIIIDEEKSDSVGTVYGKIKKDNKYKIEAYKNGYKVTIGNEDYKTLKIKE